MPFGTIISFDDKKGHGSLRPETGGPNLGFERSDISWANKPNTPMVGERLSYAVDAMQNDGQPRAVNIQPI